MSDSFYELPEEKIYSDRLSKGKFLREADVRIILDRKLREAGWDIEDKGQVSCEEPTKNGYADYLLRDRRGRGIAIIEAKRFSVDPGAGKQQALQYAKDLNVDYIFLSNSDEIYFWDHKNRPDQKVATFFSQRDLEKLKILTQERKPLSEVLIPEKYFKGGEKRILRPYQKQAMKIIDETIKAGKRRMLIVMATGTGKTDVIALQLKRLFEAGLIERVLFLVDRIELGKQAQGTFNDILYEHPSELLFGGKLKRESSIVIGTLQTIYSQLANFTSGYFDVVVSDEAHRSIYSVYNSVLSHFDAIKIGLTATPSMFIDRNTYKLFDCWDFEKERGKPTFVYGIRQGIKDKFIAGYDILRIDTKVSLKGINFEGEDFSPDDLERKINVPARNEQIVRSYRQEEDKREPARHRKAIVFAVTQKHAAQLTYYFNQMYPEFSGRFAEVITSNVPDADSAIKRFKQEELPYIAVSVGMLDTGFDHPDVENLIMVRPTKSPILYQQMRGRGSRLSQKIGKTSFRIYDYVRVTEYFNDESYNPYSELTSAKFGIPWGTEENELTQTEKETEGIVKRLFVQVPETAPENVDLVVKREHVEIGPEGEKVDVSDYQYNWENEIQALAKVDPLIQKIKDGKELSDEEVLKLSEKLNSPEFYFNEANLRAAYHYPQGTLSEFIKAALQIYELPTEEQLKEKKVNDLFESWLLEKNFGSEQARILRMVKSQYLARKERIDISILNEPLFRQIGGLSQALKVFNGENLKQAIEELNQRVFL